MQIIHRIYSIFVILFFLSILLFPAIRAAYAQNDKGELFVLTGNLICVYPNKKTEKVKPVIDTGPCNQKPDHIHFFMDTRRGYGQVYAVEGPDAAMENLEKSSQRKNTQIEGKISGNQKAWILTID